jgi:hypothetical protein
VAERKRVSELVAEVMRDVGILLFVFGPLDTLLKSGYGTKADWEITSLVALVGLILIAIGIRIGAQR